jgi:hypothetical protein
LNKNSVLLLAFLLMVPCLAVCEPVTASTEESWVSKAPMSTAKAFLGVAVVNQKIYAIGGSGGVNEEFDPASNTWTTKKSNPDLQPVFSAVACQGKIYCIGGMPPGSTGASGANKVYDPSTDSWESKSAMPTERYALQANVVNGKIYCMGGIRLLGYNLGYEEVNVTEVYDPTNDTWTTKSPIPYSGYSSTVVDNKIFLIGSTTQIYDTETDTWSIGAPPPEKLVFGGNSAIATTGIMAPKRIYVYDSSSFQIYDPQNDSWTFGTPPPTKRQYLGIGNVNDTLYFIGGMTNDPSGLPWYPMSLDTNEQYTPLGYGTLPTPTPTQQISAVFIIPILVSAVIVSLVVLAITLHHLKRFKSQDDANAQSTAEQTAP